MLGLVGDIRTSMFGLWPTVNGKSGQWDAEMMHALIDLLAVEVLGEWPVAEQRVSCHFHSQILTPTLTLTLTFTLTFTRSHFHSHSLTHSLSHSLSLTVLVLAVMIRSKELKTKISLTHSLDLSLTHSLTQRNSRPRSILMLIL